jgi:hypothetical protein
MQGLSARRGLSIMAATTLGMLGVAGVANAVTVAVNDSGSQTAPHLHAKGLLHAGSGLTHTGSMVAGTAGILVPAIAQASSGQALPHSHQPERVRAEQHPVCARRSACRRRLLRQRSVRVPAGVQPPAFGRLRPLTPARHA